MLSVDGKEYTNMSARIWDVAPMVALASNLMNAAVLVSHMHVVLPFLFVLTG